MRAAILLLLLSVPSLLRADGFVFEPALVDITAQRGAGRVEGEFRFTNKSPNPVRLRNVAPSCGCIVARPDKREYAPGEKGVIPFTYAPKGREGTKAYRVFIATSEKGPPIEVILRVTETAPRG